MSASLRITSLAIAGAAAAALAFPAATAASAAVSHPSVTAHPAAVAAKPGPVANPLVLDNNVSFSGYDAATGPNGTSYIGWISDKSGGNRQIHLCTLPKGARKCKGGVQTINTSGDSLSPSSAASLHVLVAPSGEVTLVWIHDDTASESGPMGSEIATASSDGNGVLDSAVDVAAAPSFGYLLDARIGPGGAIWVVMEPTGLHAGLLINPDINNPESGDFALKPPYLVGGAQLRFHGSQAVLAVQKAGAVTSPVGYASESNDHWSKFHLIKHTWTSDANIGLAGTTSGVRLVTSIGNADYWPVMWSWNGSTFTAATQTGDRNDCTPSSHDLVADSSGRAADVSVECSDLAIANLPDTRHAAVVRFKVPGTFAGGYPQLTTSPRGTGWVAWSVESKTGDKLLAAPILLPGRDVTVTGTGRGNAVSVTGPQSCLPPVNIGVGVHGNPGNGWHVVSKSLKLGNSTLHSSTLNGAGLAAGKSFGLTGKVVFSNGSSRSTVTVTLRFKSCANGGNSAG
jgi:hypothetical protein